MYRDTQYRVRKRRSSAAAAAGSRYPQAVRCRLCSYSPARFYAGSRLKGDHLVRQVACQGSIQVGETANDGAVHQFGVDLAFITALVATHQQGILLGRDLRETLTQRITLHQHVVVVLEKEHSDHLYAVTVLLDLRQDHLAQLAGNRVPLAGKYIRDFHWTSFVEFQLFEEAAIIQKYSTRISGTYPGHLPGPRPAFTGIHQRSGSRWR